MYFFGYEHLYYMASSLRRNPFNGGTNGISGFWFKQTMLMKATLFSKPPGYVFFKFLYKNFTRES